MIPTNAWTRFIYTWLSWHFYILTKISILFDHLCVLSIHVSYMNIFQANKCLLRRLIALIALFLHLYHAVSLFSLPWALKAALCVRVCLRKDYRWRMTIISAPQQHCCLSAFPHAPDRGAERGAEKGEGIEGPPCRGDLDAGVKSSTGSCSENHAPFDQSAP